MEGRKLHLYQPGTEGVTSKQPNLKGMTMVTNAAQNQEAAEPLQKGLGPLSWPVNWIERHPERPHHAGQVQEEAWTAVEAVGRGSELSPMAPEGTGPGLVPAPLPSRYAAALVTQQALFWVEELMDGSGAL